MFHIAALLPIIPLHPPPVPDDHPPAVEPHDGWFQPPITPPGQHSPHAYDIAYAVLVALFICALVFWFIRDKRQWMARADRRRVLAAQLSGVAAAVAQVRRITAEEGLAELQAEMIGAKVKPGSETAVKALTMAASTYAVDRPRRDEWWFPEAFAFLVEAGADPDEAREIRRATPVAGPVGPDRTPT